MFGKKKRIAELESQLAELSQSHDAAAQECARLKGIIERAGGGEMLRIQEQIDELIQQRSQVELEKAATVAQIDAEVAERSEQAKAAEKAVSAANSELVRLRRELSDLEFRLGEARLLDESGLTNYANPAESSVALGEELASVRARIKELVKQKKATTATTNFTFNNSVAKGRNFVNNMSKMMLRAYNAEAENCMLTVKAGNGESAKKRLDRARAQVRRLGSMITLDITTEYHMLRQRELALTLKYQNAKKAEKEAEREERARLREERKAQQEFEAQRRDLMKQRQHYLNVLETLKSQGRQDEINEIEGKIAGLDEEIESVDYRAANIRAGYVYVISNIGSFGERMVKIGLTRRLDPMDRIRELSDASVPFNFDVHALFFSEDAVTLETELHHRFADRRVNRINQRREFFYATPAEVREVLKEVGGNLLEFIEEPEAEQYRLSLQIASSDAASSAGESREDPRR